MMPRLLALLALCQTCSAGSVIGIDFGSEFLKISLVKPGVPLDIVLTLEGKRKQNTMVGYYDGEQLLGLAAENMVGAAISLSSPFHVPALTLAACFFRSPASLPKFSSTPS